MSNISSSVQPSESISSVPRRKPKPGKAERAAKRASSAAGSPADASKAAAFAAGARGDPVAQPGRYPVVFATGAGEPARDSEFTLSGPTVWHTVLDLPGRYMTAPQYAEFRSHVEETTDTFSARMRVAFLLGLCEQVVHSHVNMDLPQHDFAPMSSTDIQLPGAFRAILSQFGEFSEPSLGTRFLFKDYPAVVRQLVWWANEVWNGRTAAVSERGWLPQSQNDGHSRTVIARALLDWLDDQFNIQLSERLDDAVGSGEVPDWWEALKPLFGDEPETGPSPRDRFDFLFKSYSDVGQFFSAYSAKIAVLNEIGLSWRSPSAGHMDWSFNAKYLFTSLCDKWARFSAAYAKFFDLSSSLVSRSVASGTMAQFTSVTTVDVVTVVKSLVALAAPQFSLVACFPAECISVRDRELNVVVSTPVSVSQRATEFLQQDWR